MNQQELAQILQLSQTTVSRALANHPSINPETKAQVLETAARLGYGSRLRRNRDKASVQQQMVIGILIALPNRRNQVTETFQLVLKGISDKSSLHDSVLDVVYHEPAVPDASRLLKRIRQARWKGAVLIYPLDRGLVHEIAHQCACVSIIENYRHDLIDSLDVDQVDGIAQMVQRLAAHQHRKIGFLSWHYSVPTPWVQHRFGGFVESIYQLGLEFDPRLSINVRKDESHTPEDCTEKVLQWLQEGVTGIVCAADHQAYRLWADLQARGIRLPEDVSITGFDGIPPPAGAPQLATIRVPYEELGRSAIHQMMRRREEPTAPRRHLVVDGEFIEGATLGPARNF